MKALGYIDGNVVDIDLPYEPKNGARFLETVRQLLDCQYLDFQTVSHCDVVLVMQDVLTRCSSPLKRISTLELNTRGNILFISTGYRGNYIDIKDDLAMKLKADLKMKE